MTPIELTRQLAACHPKKWVKELTTFGDTPYVLMGFMAGDLARWGVKKTKKAKAAQEIFDILEEALQVPSPELTNLIKAGFIEDLQYGLLQNHKKNPDRYTPFMGIRFLKEWEIMIEAWSGIQGIRTIKAWQHLGEREFYERQKMKAGKERIT